MKKIKTQKGITLIALIITIVVLLILAVVAIRVVQGNGIIAHAQNAADEYTAKANGEQETINGYLSQIEESLSGKTKITWKMTSEGELAVGSTVVTSTGENFYVIGFKDNNETVKLLAKDNIDTTDLVQSASAEHVVFCEDSVDGYWGNEYNDEGIIDIEETQPIPSTHTAAYAADRYGATLGVTGRLMLYSETDDLNNDDYSDILYGKNGKSSSSDLDYWLGNALNLEDLFYVENGYIDSCKRHDFVCGVRPVVEVSSSNIS